MAREEERDEPDGAGSNPQNPTEAIGIPFPNFSLVRHWWYINGIYRSIAGNGICPLTDQRTTFDWTGLDPITIEGS